MSSPSLPLSPADVPATTQNPAWRERFFYSLTLVLSMVFWLPQAIRWMDEADFGPHGEFVKQALDNLPALIGEVPHFMFHVLSALVVRLTGWEVDYSMALVVTLAMLVLAAILFWLYRRALAGSQVLTWEQGALVVTAVLVTGIVAPLNLLTPNNYYFGYFAPNVYHNPTVNLMKPAALVLFFIGVMCFSATWRTRHLLSWLLGSVLLTVVCVYSKPSFTIAFLPALALVTLFFLVRRRPIHWLLLLGGLVLPAGLLLLLQMQSSRIQGIEIAPLRLYELWALHYNPVAGQVLGWKHIASVAFPGLVYLLFARAAVRSVTLNLAWLTFLVGMIYADVILDRGNPVAGDFTWSAQFGVYLLFVVSLWFLLARRQPTPRRDWRLWVCAAVLGLHVIAGVVWYGLHLTQPYMTLIYHWW